MAYDLLEPFLSPEERQRRQQQRQQAQTVTEQPDELRALRVAIEALNQIPNTPLSGEYTSTCKLIPDLEKAYRAGTERTRLEELAPRMYMTLLLCEDVLSELGRLDDGTPSISALIDIQEIQKEAGNLSEEQVIRLMQGIPIQAPAEQDIAGGKAQPEQSPAREPSASEPERNMDLEPDVSEPDIER